MAISAIRGTILLLFFAFFVSLAYSLNRDGLSLLALKAAITTDPTRVLSTWSDTDYTPCHWVGISCDHLHRVTSIFLPARGFTGYLPSELGALLYLRRLSLPHNNFSGAIPSHLFNNATHLLSLDLSHNSLTAPIPNLITTSLKNLNHLDLSSNLLNGSLPQGLDNLSMLAGTVNFSYNHFTGEVPASYGLLPLLVSLDLRHNNLTGKIPLVGSLLNQGPTSFSGNPYLCGFPLQTVCAEPEARNPRIYSVPKYPRNPSKNGGLEEEGERGKVGSVTVPIISGVTVVIGMVFVSALLLGKKWRSSEEEEETKGKGGGKEEEKEKQGQNGKFVVVEGEKLGGFELEIEELLRASARVVGKSRSGIVYKVVVGRGAGGAPGTVVAVRRLNELGDARWRLKEFEAEVECIGRVQHPNIVRLRAYYHADDEKLLVSDFICNGTLYTALHGASSSSSSSSAVALSWAARLKIAQCTARALAHIHECSCSSSSRSKHFHGNIRSSKILLDDELNPYISGFGLARLCKTAGEEAATTQHHHHHHLKRNLKVAKDSYDDYSAAAFDVYSFGMVLLEMLTGKVPDASLDNFVRKVFRDEEEENPLPQLIDPSLVVPADLNAKDQLLSLFHTALSCTQLLPQLRPQMTTVSRALQRASC